MKSLEYLIINTKNPDYVNIISWTQDGNAFVVKNISELAEKVNDNDI